MAAPGNYTATLNKQVDGEMTALSGPVQFEVVPLRTTALEGSSPAEAAAFWRSYEDAVRQSTAMYRSLSTELARVDAMRVALSRATAAPGDLDQRLNQLGKTLLSIEDKLLGNRAKREVGEKTRPNIASRLNAVELGVYHSTYGPTATLEMTLDIVADQLQQVKIDLTKARAGAAALGTDLIEAGAPWVEGNPLPE